MRHTNLPCDCPLLKPHKASSFRRRCNFTKIHWYLSRADADRQSVDESSYNQHGDILRRADNNRANAPITISMSTQNHISKSMINSPYYSTNLD